MSDPVASGGPMMNTAILVAIGASFGLIAGFWSKVKAFFANIFSLLIVNVKIEGQVAYAVIMYVLRNYKRVPFGSLVIRGQNDYVRKTKRNQLIAFKMLPNAATLWYGHGKFFWLQQTWTGITFRFIRGKIKPYEFIATAVESFNDHKAEVANDSRFFVRRMQGTVGEKLSTALKGSFSKNKGGDDASPGEEDTFSEWSPPDKYIAQPIGYDSSEIGQPLRDEAIEQLALRQEALDAYEDICRWQKMEEWYKSKNIPWGLGWLMVGPPGTGKTAFARGVGQTRNLPVFIFDLASMTNKDFVDAWKEMMDWTPCIFLVEDIHAVYDGTKRIADTGDEAGLTFDCLLNVLDGVENTDGVVIMFTSNEADKVDWTLGGNKGSVISGETRPGRVDRVLHFGSLDRDGVKKVATRILGEFPQELWIDILKDGTGKPGAMVQDMCRLRGLDLKLAVKDGDK